jgi:YrbI family 3-deoxy-D-manno-octulosonate 8-phosphate phosphatase
MDVAGFRRAEHRFFGRVGIAVVPEHSAIEIDTEQQLAMSSALAALVAPAAPLDVDAIVTDFDGVHTDDHAFVDQDGHEFVSVSREDGMGVSLLKKAGVPLLILSTETNPVVNARATKLGVDVIQGLSDKAGALAAWADRTGVDLNRVAYLGNDVNDLGCFDLVGWPVAVPDAHPRVLASARVVLSRPGGDGAVRELAERVLQSIERKRKVS